MKKIKPNLKEKFKFYKVLQKLKPDMLKDVIQHLDDNSVDALCECVYNVIYSDMSMSPKTKKMLRKKLKKTCSLQNLKNISSKKVSVSKRRQALSQEGSGIGLILATVVPWLANLIFNRKKSQ